VRKVGLEKKRIKMDVYCAKERKTRKDMGGSSQGRSQGNNISEILFLSVLNGHLVVHAVNLT